MHIRFKSLSNGEEVLYAKVSNSTGDHKLSNINGEVDINYVVGSELVVTHLVYDSLIIKTKEWKGQDSLEFYLTPKVYNLKVVTFSILGERSLFDNKFVKNDLGTSDEEKVKERLGVIDMKQELIALDRSAQSGVVLGSPISYLYDRFSKKGKERSKYNALVARDRRIKEAGKKFDDYTVLTLTNFEGEQLIDFKAFCSFHPSYLEAVSALELYFEILRCRDEYRAKGY